MLSNTQSLNKVISVGSLGRVHHIALNVQDMNASRHFYANLKCFHK
ncbi:MAG: VOC family protein, partial [Cyanobacteria bacterium J06628_3]